MRSTAMRHGAPSCLLGRRTTAPRGGDPRQDIGIPGVGVATPQRLRIFPAGGVSRPPSTNANSRAARRTPPRAQRPRRATSWAPSERAGPTVMPPPRTTPSCEPTPRPPLRAACSRCRRRRRRRARLQSTGNRQSRRRRRSSRRMPPSATTSLVRARRRGIVRRARVHERERRSSHAH